MRIFFIGRLQFLAKFPGTSDHNHDFSQAANLMKAQLKRLGTKGMQMLRKKQPVRIYDDKRKG